MAVVNKLNRRGFLKGAAMAAVGALAASCAQPTAQIVEKQVPVEKIVKETVVVQKEVAVEKVVTATPVVAKYKEAPMLTGLVEAGKLPPVDERVPEEPLIITPIEEVGQYGGTWHRLANGPSDIRTPDRLVYDSLVRWDLYGADVVPSVAKSWEIAPDGTTFTFNLRKGIKWSDATPYTADDILFYMADVIGNTDINPAFPGWLKPGAAPVEFSKLDDYTVQFKFDQPYGLFMTQLPSSMGLYITIYPKHYMQQFHASYADKAQLDALVKEAGVENWVQLFGSMYSHITNLDLPVIAAWRVTVPSPKQPVVLERNPYYWKVDTEGNQLPYIDRIEHMIVGDVEMLNARAIAGEVDMQLRNITFANYPVFMENREAGDYRVLTWDSAGGSEVGIHPNVAHKDPVMRKIINEPRFHWALSLGLKRDDLIETVTLGLGTPTQVAPLPSSPFYWDEQATNMIEYDPDQANQYLDEMGLTERDSDGYRLRPDGKRLSLTFEYVAGWGDDTAQLAVGYWKALGIEVIAKEEARQLFTERTIANEHDIVTWPTRSAFGFMPLVNPADFVPSTNDGSKFATVYGEWYASGGKSGEEPTGQLREVQVLYDQIKGTADVEEQKRLFRQILEINKENIWVIGTVTTPPQLIVVKNSFRNVPDKSISSWELLSPGNTMPEQYFIKQ